MALGTPSVSSAGGSRTIKELLAAGERSISFEFFPPKDEAGERQLWTALRELEPLQPTFVSVTYGAGGSTRDRTVHITEGIARETTLTPMAHLTCVGHSREELRSVIGAYAAAGVRNVLALRGDPPEGPTAEFVPHPEGLHNAIELVELVKDLGDFSVGVAAFPDVHPAAESAESDARYLVAKARAGADFAITQLFFRPEDYFALVARVSALGADLPIIPGIMPITNLAQVTRMAELSGAELPSSIVERVSRFEGDPAAVRAEEYFALVERVAALGVDIPIVPGIMPITNLAQVTRMAELSGAELPASIVERVSRFDGDPAAVRAEGIAIATELCDALLAGGAPGLHFYTLNRSKATREIYAGLHTSVG